jgi:hypothetical protein
MARTKVTKKEKVVGKQVAEKFSAVAAEKKRAKGGRPAKGHKKKKNFGSFSVKAKIHEILLFKFVQVYIYRVLKQVHPDTGISSKAMSIMNSYVFYLGRRRKCPMPKNYNGSTVWVCPRLPNRIPIPNR